MGAAASGIAVLAGYVLGTAPTALVVGRRRGVDPTAAGSGNPGASNVYRTAGRAAGLQVLAGDIAKGAAAAGLGWWAGGRFMALLAGLAAVLGHVAPLTRDLRGGKGVATAAGALLVSFPLPALAGVLTWLLVIAVWRTASVASLLAMLGIVVVVVVVGPAVRELAVVAAIAVVVLVRHRSNLRRLAAGEEQTIRGARRR